MPKPIKETMTPEEVATFWYQKSTELEAKLKDSENARRNLAIENGDLKNKYTALKLSAEEDIRRLNKSIDHERSLVCQKENDVELYMKRWYQTNDELKITQQALADMNKQIDEISSMTYEQIIDLKCENARRREENRQRKEQEIRLVKELVNKAEDYRIAKEIREYIQAMIDSGNEDITPEWIEWALKKADWYDPSIETEDEYLGKRQHEKSAEEKEKSLQDSIRKSWYW